MIMGRAETARDARTGLNPKKKPATTGWGIGRGLGAERPGGNRHSPIVLVVRRLGRFIGGAAMIEFSTGLPPLLFAGLGMAQRQREMSQPVVPPISPKLTDEFFEAVREYIRWAYGHPQEPLPFERYVQLCLACGRVANSTELLPQDVFDALCILAIEMNTRL